jgi:hypothetical protein
LEILQKEEKVRSSSLAKMAKIETFGLKLVYFNLLMLEAYFQTNSFYSHLCLYMKINGGYHNLSFKLATKQRLAKVQAKSEARESRFMLLGM